jgi:hypothetical protein
MLLYRSSVLQRDSPELQKMKFLHFFSLLVGLLDPDLQTQLNAEPKHYLNCVKIKKHLCPSAFALIRNPHQLPENHKKVDVTKARVFQNQKHFHLKIPPPYSFRNYSTNGKQKTTGI